MKKRKLEETLSITVNYWDSNSDRIFSRTKTLEEVIRNPNGYRLSDIGLVFLNIERKKRRLNQYEYNSETKTYDEIS